ncbi:hypothetical protein [uncultured Sulfitobacter sp.]|nr:hypothetical protein [uncultured Sulfitobacter sp.]
MDQAQLLTLTALEMTLLVGGLRSLVPIMLVQATASGRTSPAR